MFFEISTDNDDEDDDGEIKLDNKKVWGDIDPDFYAGLRPEEIYDIHVQDIKVWRN